MNDLLRFLTSSTRFEPHGFIIRKTVCKSSFYEKHTNCVYKLARGVKADRLITNVRKTRAGRIKSYLSSFREPMRSVVLIKKNKHGDVCGRNKHQVVRGGFILQHTDANSFSKAALIFTDPILMMRVLTMATPSSLERGGRPQGGRSYTA